MSEYFLVFIMGFSWGFIVCFYLYVKDDYVKDDNEQDKNRPKIQ